MLLLHVHLATQKLDPLINKLTAQYKASITPEAQKKAMALMFSSDATGSRQTDDQAMTLEYEYQNSGLLSLPDELMLLIFKFFKDKPLCLGRLSMSCKQLYMLTCTLREKVGHRERAREKKEGTQSVYTCVSICLSVSVPACLSNVVV